MDTFDQGDAMRWEILSFQLQGSEGVDFSAIAQRTSGCRLKWPIFLRSVAMGPVSPLDLRLRPPDRPTSTNYWRPEKKHVAGIFEIDEDRS